MLVHPYRIIGITGKKRHGKDSVARFLPSEYLSFSLAEPVKDIAREIYGLRLSDTDGSAKDKERILPDWGLSPRQILQRIGTEMGRSIHPETWTRYVKRKMDEEFSLRKEAERSIVRGVRAAVITDVRFPNEADAVRSWGGVIWRVIRPGYEDQGDTHASETESDLIEPNLTIVNDGTLEDLRTKVQEANAIQFEVWKNQ
jgi:hypothetical protein